jgi:hypothetical protein
VKDVQQWLSFLPESVAKKLAYENAQKLFLDHEKIAHDK